MNTVPATSSNIFSLEDAFKKLETGEIDGFECSIDNTFYPMAIVARVRRWGKKDEPHTFQIREIFYGMGTTVAYELYMVNIRRVFLSICGAAGRKGFFRAI